MKRRAVLFFPQNLYPPLSGLHNRGLTILSALRELGFQTTLVSPMRSAGRHKWSEASVQSLRESWCSDVRLYRFTMFDRRCAGLIKRSYRLLGIEPPIDSMYKTPPGMRLWFSRALHEVAPDVILMTYADWDGLLDHRLLASTRRIIDTIDLITLNRLMVRKLQHYLPAPPIRASQVEDCTLREDFYERLGLSASPDEFRVYDRYDYAIAISAKEAEIMTRNTHKTRVVFLPMSYEPVRAANSYAGPAVFTTGPNVFNVQGYLYFARRVLPKIRAIAPSFTLRVTGLACSSVVAEEGITLSGIVPDLAVVYAEAPFLVCPIFGGTGQQTKIVEAMAHGVPAIVLQAAAEASPIRHGVNGLVACDAEEFAEHVLYLWSDRTACRRLGQAARETIAAEFSRSRQVEALSTMLG